MEALFTRISLLQTRSAATGECFEGAVSRIEGKIGSDDDLEIEAADIFAALAADRRVETPDRKAAFARYLSGGDGWRDALQQLDGAFAPAGSKKQG